MKVRLNKKPVGVVLIVALFIIVAAGIVLASYLTLMSNETRTVGRSQVWDKCVPVMEAGIEEAMAQIQYCGGTTNLGSNGWTLNATNYYQKTRYVGTNGSYCVVRIQPVIPPVIYSTAYVPVSDTSSNYISRTVRVSTTNGNINGGMIASGVITMSGGTQLDSYNSNIAPYNSANPGTNVVAKTLSGVANAVNLGPKGSAHIYGLAITGPGGTIGMGGGSYIGPPPSTGNGAIVSGWTNNDANFQINSNALPSISTTNGWSISGTLPGPGVIVTTNFTIGVGGVVNISSYTTNSYAYLYTTGKYEYNGSVSLTGTNNMGIKGNVVLYVTGSFTIANGCQVYIAPASSLTLYLGGCFTNQGAGVVNSNAIAADFTLYGLVGCTNVTIANGTSLYGTLSAPNGAVSVSGAGDLYGQIIGNTITISGGGNVHYDQALSGSQYFNAFGWNEL